MESIALPPTPTSFPKLLLSALRVPNKTFNPSLTGKTALITGSNSGIGLACAGILPRLGLTHLIMAVRSVARGEEAAASIRKTHPELRLDVWELDMLSYPSIQAFAKRCATLSRLDIAILNAGMGGGSVSKMNASTKHEETLQVNYLSTALLAILLLPVLKPRNAAQGPGRLTIVGSAMGLVSAFENRNAVPLIASFDTPFKGFGASGERYAATKTMVMMLVHKLSEAVSAEHVIINTVEPGFTTGTALHRDFTGAAHVAMVVIKKVMSRTPEQAAWTYVDAAVVKGKESHGGFLLFWRVVP